MKNYFNLSVSLISGFLSYWFGGFDTTLIVLITFIVLDYLTGIIYAIETKTVNSEIGFKGLLKKFTIIILLILAVMLDKLFNDKFIFRTMVCYFYIANEGISVLENTAKIGIPYPQSLLNALQQLQKKEGEKNENNQS